MKERIKKGMRDKLEGKKQTLGNDKRINRM
jgi:hypothetical protein